MYNEDENELKNTLRGVIQNYNCLRLDQYTKFTKDDLCVLVVCDGYERIPESFKNYARSKGFLDENRLVEQGFMTCVDGVYKMKDISDCMEIKSEETPQNVLHCF